MSLKLKQYMCIFHPYLLFFKIFGPPRKGSHKNDIEFGEKFCV